jgi:hypothetical protein
VTTEQPRQDEQGVAAEQDGSADAEPDCFEVAAIGRGADKAELGSRMTEVDGVPYLSRGSECRR